MRDPNDELAASGQDKEDESQDEEPQLEGFCHFGSFDDIACPQISIGAGRRLTL